MRRIYQVAALALLALAAFMVWEALRLNYYTSRGPGAGFFPFWIGLFLGGLSFAWLMQVSVIPQGTVPEDLLPDRRGALRVTMVAAAILLFSLLVDTLGFQLMMFGLLFFLLTALGRQSAARVAVISIIGSVGVYHLFKFQLGVYLPESSVVFLRELGL